MTYQQTLNYLYSFIPEGKQSVFPGETGLLRTRYLLNQLGNPQNKLKVIHIAGTSGKGSTAFMLSQLLRNHGYNIGLQVSPHLVDIRERFQINNKLISKKDLRQTMHNLKPLIEQMRSLPFGAPTYFEIVVVIAFSLFYEKKVDYAVIETGMGGLLDATNCVDNPDKIAVITRIGHDHMHILGNTLSRIAMQKAGIIHNGNAVFVLKQRISVMRVIKSYAHSKHAAIHEIESSYNHHLKMQGSFQQENASMAIAAFRYVSERDRFYLDEEIVDRTLSTVSFPGRMDMKMINGKQVIIDGAHNPQKMKALTRALKDMFPKEKFVFVIAFKKHKDYRAMLCYITPLARKIYITTYPVTTHMIKAEAPEIIAEILKSMNFIAYKQEPEYSRALEESYQEDEPVVVTGSLYLAGAMYKVNE